MSSNIYKQKKHILTLITLTSDATPRIKRPQYKTVGKMKPFVRREYLAKFNTMNLVNGCGARLEMRISVALLYASSNKYLEHQMSKYVPTQPSVKK